MAGIIDQDDLDLQLTIDLWLLDALLTGKDSRSCRGAFDKMVECDEFLGGLLYYLSDGGYSRVFCTIADENVVGTLHLSSESRQEVKDKWNDYQVGLVRRRIERTMDKYCKT